MAHDHPFQTIRRIALIPGTGQFLRNRVFGPDLPFYDGRQEPYRHLRRALEATGRSLDTWDEIGDLSQVDLVIVSRVDRYIRNLYRILRHNPKVFVVLLITEPVTVAPLFRRQLLFRHFADRIVTWNERLLSHPRAVAYRYPGPHRDPVEISEPFSRDLLCYFAKYHPPQFNRSGELYSFRIRLIEELLSESGFHLYGTGWADHLAPSLQSGFRGAVDEKLPVQARYRFGLAIENTINERGYVSEKIFDIMAAGSVPVYWGNLGRLDRIPRDTFIDGFQFRSGQELMRHLEEMSPQVYDGYLDRIGRFLRSRDYEFYTSRGFVETMMEMIEDLETESSGRGRWNIPLTKIRCAVGAAPLAWYAPSMTFKFVQRAIRG
jgi:hypothetical protein